MMEQVQIKGYQLEDMIGRGGYGAVYRARQAIVDREVAVKVILPEFANQPEFIRRFEVEAQTVARLEHPFIVPLFDYWRDPNGAYLVMRWLRGGSLFQKMRERELFSMLECYEYLRQIASALSFAHRSGVIHRDMKPGNILLDEDNNAYLSDFGIAKLSDQTTDDLDNDALVGSPGYLSPEQISGDDVTPQSDMYSLGIMLFEMITGKHPFRSYGQPVSQLLYRHLQDPLPSVLTINSKLPFGLDTVLATATAKNPQNRYADFQTLVEAFGELVEENRSNKVRTGELVITGLNRGNPYKGLRPFDEVDAGDFFGREKLTLSLIEHFEQGNRFLAVIGPSGSGKSSVVQAGLIPALRGGSVTDSQDWYFADMVPSDNPIQQLAAALTSVAANSPEHLEEQLRANDRGLLWGISQVLGGDEGDLFLMIDQFEEVFTQTEQEQEREQFLKLLYHAVSAPDSRLRLVVTLRADFYDRPLLYSEFGELIQQYTQVVLPLSAGEIERVITMPAQQAGVGVDTDLIAAIVDDVREEPGALPLLQYALTELFEERENNRMTLAAYQVSGGVVGALARRAEQVYESFSDDLKPLAKQIFLRLITLGEGREDTRRRVPRSELMSVTRDQDQLETILSAFGRFRLLTFDRDPETREPMVEVAHEALIREWNRIQTWLDATRDDVRLQRVLAAAAAEWFKAGQDFSYLMRGGQLAQYEEWWRHTSIALTPLERDYIESSLAERQRVRNREEAQRRREARQRRLLGWLSAVAGVVAILAILGAATAYNQSLAAQRERDNAEDARATSDAQAVRAENAAATATIALGQSEIRANELQSLALLSNAQTAYNTNPSLTLALAVAANRVENAPYQAMQSLYDLAYAPGPKQLLGQHDGAIFDLAIAEGVVAAAGGDDVVRLWDIETGETLLVFTEHATDVLAVAFSPEDHLLVSGDADGSLLLWRGEDGTLIREFDGHNGAVQSVVFSPDGTRILSSGDDSQVLLWDVETGALTHTLEAHVGRVRAVAYSPDGRTVLSGGSDNRVILWDAETGEILQDMMNAQTTITTLAYLDDETAVSGTGGGRLIVWDLTNGLAQRVVTGHDSTIWDLTVLNRREFLSVSGAESLNDGQEYGEMILWGGITASQQAVYRGHDARIRAVVRDVEENRVITGADNGEILLWDLTQSDGDLQRFTVSGSGAVAVTLDTQGETLFASGGLLSPSDMTAVSGGSTIYQWDITSGDMVQRFDGHSAPVRAVELLPDGETLLSAGDDGVMLSWDIVSGEQIAAYNGHTDSIWGMALTVDGTTAATADLSGNVILWDIATGAELTRFSGYGAVYDLAFSADGQRLAFAADAVVIWDVVANTELAIYDVGGAIASVDFNLSGNTLAFATRSVSVGILDVDTGAILLRVNAATNLNRVRFNTTGQLIATATLAGVQIWDVSTGDELHYFANRPPAWGLGFHATPELGETLFAAFQDGNIRIYPVSPMSLARWTEANRYVPMLSCDQQRQYRLTLGQDC